MTSCETLVDWYNSKLVTIPQSVTDAIERLDVNDMQKSFSNDPTIMNKILGKTIAPLDKDMGVKITVNGERQYMFPLGICSNLCVVKYIGGGVIDTADVWSCLTNDMSEDGKQITIDEDEPKKGMTVRFNEIGRVSSIVCCRGSANDETTSSIPEETTDFIIEYVMSLDYIHLKK